jgi:HPt (histidine-containing phosphotransfer) domain-containing protein
LTENIAPSEKIRVQVKAILMELVPAYLKRRSEDVDLLHSYLELQDFKSIQTVGHKLRGNAATYGFHELSKIGAEIEAAAQLHESAKIQDLTQCLLSYLSKIEVVS